ncbi:MAG TPA: GxxExxY protein [Myxococcales bacterium]|jgi:GxxExxY protein|nr:GxxExxY protein [Myxococcales bacterium]
MILNQLSEMVIGAAIEVHRELGPGLLESVYEACLSHELYERGLVVERQKALPVRYKSVLVDLGLRLDLIVDGQLIIEIKSVERLERVHEKQLLSYLKLSGCHLGLLMNFNVPLMREGIRRIVHRFPEAQQKPIPSAPSASSA